MANTAPVLPSHSRAVLSREAVRMRWPSGLNAALSTQSVWPSRVASAVPLAASHSRAVPGGSEDALAVGAERDALDPARVALEGAQRGAACGIPQPSRVVMGGGDDALAVGAERGAPDPVCVANSNS